VIVVYIKRGKNIRYKDELSIIYLSLNLCLVLWRLGEYCFRTLKGQ